MSRNTCLDDYDWLVHSADSWLERVSNDSAPLHVQAAGLRRELSQQQTHLILEQVELRRRGQAKFAGAAHMFFTRVGLEQATDETLAAYKALRFPQGILVADLCCGIGGDLRALAARGETLGCDSNEIVALLGEANCRQVEQGGGVPRTIVQTCDAEALPLREVAAWHIDPDRRPSGRRSTRLELHQPGPEVLQRLRAANPSAAIKLAPAGEVPSEWAGESELEWISRDGECRQLMAWFGNLAQHPAQRRATVLTGTVPRCIVGAPTVSVPTASRIGRYVLEPDSAVLAAHLLGTLAAQHMLEAISPGSAYLTGDSPVVDPALAVFEVTDVLPFQPKRLKTLLRERCIGNLEIKKRGVPQEPESLRQQLRVPGDQMATLILARVEGTVTAILAQRVKR